LTIAITAIGRLPKGTMVHRHGAKPGDVIFVSGTIGDSALGLGCRLGTIDRAALGPLADHLLSRYLHPEPRMALAPVLRRHASSALDVSDGLVGDLDHICEISGVGGEIEANAVPLSEAARRAVAIAPGAMGSVLTGGDDYEIIATVPGASARAFSADAAAAGVPVTRIGRVLPGKGPPRVVGADGNTMRIPTRGHTHF
jgi:thiamine-monophosphate kinase